MRAHDDYHTILRATIDSPPYIVLVSLASTTRRKWSVLTLDDIIGELKKGKSLRCVSGLYDVPKSTVVSHSQTL